MVFGTRYQRMAELLETVVDFFRLLVLVVGVCVSYLAFRIALAFGR